jgi:hypothetical protein
MSDVFRDVTNRSLGDNLIESIKGMLVGAVLFAVAFPLLWWNEGRTDISTVAKKAVVVSPDGSKKGDGEGKLVSVTGKLEPGAPLGDPDYLKPGSYARLRREVEMFAWVESKSTKEEKKLGGGSREVTTYTYDLKWTSSPGDPEDFAHPEGHENPKLDVSGKSFYAPQANLGVYGFVPEDVELPPSRPVTLSADNVVPSSFHKTGDFLYRGKGSADAPKLGDVRISYSAVENGRKVTLYGKQEGTQVVAYLHEGKDKLFRVVDGTHEEAIATLHGEHTTTTWILRLVGFLFMWFGLALVLGPINAVLDIVPFIGSTGRALTSIALFPIALVLSGVTIVTAIVAHNPILLVVVVAAVVGGFAVLVMRKRAAKKAASTAAKAA